MTCFIKRRITPNLLQVALLLLYLRGEFPFTYNNNRNNNFSNNSNPEYNLGHSWGYAQTNFHQNGFDGFNIHPKSVNSFEQNYEDYTEEDILDLLRTYDLSSFRSHISSITKVSDAVPSFQNVTAYLLSNTSASFSNLPPSIPPIRQSPLVQVNANVPSSNPEALNDTPSSVVIPSEPTLLPETDSDDELPFHLISGNIVFLPEPDTTEDAAIPDGVLANLLLPQNSSDSSNENVMFEKADDVKPSSSQSVVYGENAGSNNDVSNWSPLLSDYEQSENFLDQLQNDMGQLLDEDFSLGLAGYDVDDVLAIGDVLVADTAQNRYGYDSADDDLTMTAIPPMSLHTASSSDEDSIALDNVDTDDGASSSSPSSHASGAASPSSSSSRFHSTTNTDEWSEMDDNTAALDSIIDELWETDSGIFETLLESPDEQPGVAALLEEVESGPSSPEKSVQAVEESSQSSSGNTPESVDDDDEVSELVEGSEMIQTASIYANARPSHPAQQRGFQVHARMQGILRGSSMDQRWQELASLLSLQPQHDPNGNSLPPPLPHHFPPHHHHHHHHLHHPSSSLHPHHSMHHHPPFSSAGPPAVPYPDTTRSVLLQNASLPIPPPEINTTSPYPNVAMGPPPNLGSALASSMHITNSSDPMIDPSSHYKMMEPTHHDMLYYPNMTSNAEMSNQTTEGFLSSILNDDDLQLMDMAMNEGMYTMRMMDNSSGAVGNGGAGPGVGIHQVHPPQSNITLGAGSVVSAASAVAEDRMEASSDSAVSSMGSERVPPMTDPHMSDNEWGDADAHPHSSHDSSYTSDYTGKLRGYDYYGKGDIHRASAPVAQKKHQMFGKRVQHDQGVHPYALGPHSSSGPWVSYPPGSGVHQSSSGMDPLEMKYSSSVDFVRHDADGRSVDGPAEIHNNHSYSLPQSHLPNSAMSLRSQRPPTKEKSRKEYLSRDEKRARALNLPITTDDVINLPMDEFNERLSKYELSESQLSLIRDIRRRGKNKVAAQNCRKRKLDQILQLADEVQRIRDKKSSLMRDQERLMARRNEVREKYSQLYRTVFQALRDPAGNPYSPLEWSLQQAADGNMILVPRNAFQPSTSGSSDSLDSSIRRGKTKDEIKKDGQA